MKPPIDISINPTYYCNFRCGFCYLTEKQLSSKQKLNPAILSIMLQEISRTHQIRHVDLYGGEITVLPRSYQQELLSVIRSRTAATINLVTNLTVPESPLVQDPDVTVSVSYDQLSRQYHDRTITNMMALQRSFSVITLCSKDFLDNVDIDVYVDTMNMFGKSLSLVEIKPYSSNQANQHIVPYTRYEQFVIDLIEHPRREFHLRNMDYMDQVIDGTHNAYSNDHVYITPNDKYAVLEFDLLGNEYFKELDRFEDYIKWADQEPARMDTGKCKDCKYRGKCLSEHLQHVESLDDSCNGFYNLLEYWENDSV